MRARILMILVLTAAVVGLTLPDGARLAEAQAIEEAHRPVVWYQVVTNGELSGEEGYNAAGDLTVQRAVAADGTLTGRTEFWYDEDGRCLRMENQLPDGTVTGETAYAWDEAGRLRTSADSAQEQVVYTYTFDEAGRVTGTTAAVGGQPAAMQEVYTYTETEAGLETVCATLDAEGVEQYRVTTVSDGDGRVLGQTYSTPPHTTAYQYDEAGREIERVTTLYTGETERTVTSYGADGHLCAQTTYDTDGQPVLTIEVTPIEPPAGE